MEERASSMEGKKPPKGRKKTMKKMKHWFEKKVLLLPPGDLKHNSAGQ